MEPTAVYNSNLVKAGFDSAVGPAFSAFETVRQLNIGILPVKWGRRVSLEANTGCWRWLGFIDSEGYGKVSHKGRTYKVHRLIYSFVFDDIGTAPVLDHRCHEADKACRGGKTCLHRRCVNPLHLMPTSSADNSRRGRRWKPVEHRKTHCVHGHAFTEENTIFVGRSGRQCKTCRRAAQRKWYIKNHGDYTSAAAEQSAKNRRKPVSTTSDGLERQAV